MAEKSPVYGEVVSTQRLTPQLVRVVLGGPGLDGFGGLDLTDAYVNAFFLPPGAAVTVPFDDEEVRGLSREHRPFPRRYTVRRWDGVRRELTIDFVVHGDVGLAGAWADRARPGDRLQLRGPAGGYTPHPEADHYLFVGDESALPAIAASAEAVPAGRRVVVVAEVSDGTGELPLTSPGELTVHWVHRAGRAGELETLLVDAVRALPRPVGEVSAFVHGEAVATRAVRRFPARGRHRGRRPPLVLPVLAPGPHRGGVAHHQGGLGARGRRRGPVIPARHRLSPGRTPS